MANSTGGVGDGGIGVGGTAFAKTEAKNSSEEVITTASAPGSGVRTSPSALTLAGVGTGNVALAPTFTSGQVVSNAVLTPGGGTVIGVGAFSAAYGGLALQYAATAGFDFTPSNREGLDLKLISDEDVGVGLDSLQVKVSVVSAGLTTNYDKTFALGSAESFFKNNRLIQLGAVAAGSLSFVTITYDLTYNSGTLAAPSNGFGFTYDLIDPPLTVPEASTWAMMLIGFADLGFVGYRRVRAARIRLAAQIAQRGDLRITSVWSN
jgi:hypothetical protein